MGQPSTPRKKGDELLLAATGDGWVHRDDVVRHMMQYVMPGQAHRFVAGRRKNSDDPRHRDALRVGSRQIANQTLSNALKTGVWVRDGDRIRHRDWTGEAAPVASPSGGFSVPSMDEVRHHVALTGFTKWHWAAVVACYVVESEHGGDRSKGKNHLAPKDFADLGITGLTDPKTVRQYLHNWLGHAEGVRPEPGEIVEIPPMDIWPSKRTRKRERPAASEVPQRSRPWHQRLAETNDPVEAAAIIRKHTRIPDEIGRELLRHSAPAPVAHLRAVN